MRFRKTDYIIFHFLAVIFSAMNLYSIAVSSVFKILIASIVPALVLGTITNVLSLLVGALRIYINKNS